MPKGIGRPENKMERTFPVQTKDYKEHRDHVRESYAKVKEPRPPAEPYGRTTTGNPSKSRFNEKTNLWE